MIDLKTRDEVSYVLGIETSCDETSAAVVKNGREVLSNVISSQIDLHKEYGGVVPEIASRRHVELIIPVVDKAIAEAGITREEISAIAVTFGPGLVGALLVGVSVAKALAFSLKVPLVPVHHIEGHIAANYIADKYLEPHFVCLVVSGGHSHIVKVIDYDKFEILGKTRDDAAGEAFDKVARVLELGYPGGPIIDKLSKQADAFAINFPKTSFGKGIYDFSFSGIKTAVINYNNTCKNRKEEVNVENVCASFQRAVVDVLVKNTIDATLNSGLKKVAIAGGVAANSALRDDFLKATKENSLEFYHPSIVLCTDNAAMIACSGYYNYQRGHIASMDLNAIPNIKIGDWLYKI